MALCGRWSLLFNLPVFCLWNLCNCLRSPLCLNGSGYLGCANAYQCPKVGSQSVPRYRLIRTWAIRQGFKYANVALSGGEWEVGISVYSVCTEALDDGYRLFPLLLMPFWNSENTPKWPPEPGCQEMCHLGSSHKSWDARHVHRAFTELLITWERGTSWSVPRWCPPVCTSSGLGWGLWGECLSVSVWIFFLFIQYVRVMQLVSGFYLEGIVPYVTVDLVCLWEERHSGAFFVTYHL